MKFLRHVERTSFILHLLDISNASQRNPINDYLSLNQELSLFDPEVAEKPQLVAVNKMDTPEAEDKLPEVRRYFKKIKKKVYPISALTGEGLPDLLAALAGHLSKRSKGEEPS